MSMDWKLEVVVVPVSDVDRAKAFYSEQLGFNVDGPLIQLVVKFAACGRELSPESPTLAVAHARSSAV
jgi:catechol 2,3-dioxygenase-like lactoylglutathione lyase family enzyme